MKTFQTQCTNCRHIFTISDSQLAFKNGLARCGHCKQIFSAKDNLIAPPPLTESQKQALADLKAGKDPVIQPVIQPVHAPSVISPDDLPQVNPADAVANVNTLNLSSVTEVSSELEQAPASLSKKRKKVKTGEGLISDDSVPEMLVKDVLANSPSAPSASGFELDLLEDFELPSTYQTNKPVAQSVFQPEPPAVVTTKASITGDESWLETMLEEEKIKERDKSFLANSQTNPMGAKSDVADLLDDLGVAVVPETALSQEAYVQKLSERLEHTTNSQQAYQKKSLLMPVLWGLGCLLLMGLLAVQYVVFNVNDLMKDKQHAQTLTGLCQATHLPCHLAQADLASMDIKTLKVEANGEKTDVLFTLTNKSSEPVLYPNLKISLQNNNSSIATLVLSPEQYLEEKTDQIAPQLIKPVKLRLNVARDSFDQVYIESFY